MAEADKQGLEAAVREVEIGQRLTESRADFTARIVGAAGGLSREEIEALLAARAPTSFDNTLKWDLFQPARAKLRAYLGGTDG